MKARLCFVVESGTDVRMVEGLAERFDLSVVARKIEGGVEISHTPEKPVPIHVGPPSRAGFARRVHALLRRDRGSIDYVLVQGYAMAALAANLAALSTRIPTAVLVCSPAELYYRCRQITPAPNKPFRTHEMLALQMLARVNAMLGERYFVLSEHLAEVVRGHGMTRRVDVVPVYGVDTQLFIPPLEAKAALKTRAGLSASGSLVFFSSRIAAEKDAGTLLAAVASLLARGRDLWLLHRSGGYREFIREAERFGIASRVIASDAIHPHRELVLDYQASDICIQASREEGLGFSPLEAMSCHVPVIAAAVGGLRETVVDGCTGWTYPVGNSEALASHVEKVLDNPAEAQRRAAGGREMVCRRYDRRVVFDRLENLIKHDCLRLSTVRASMQRSRA